MAETVKPVKEFALASLPRLGINRNSYSARDRFRLNDNRQDKCKGLYSEPIMGEIRSISAQKSDVIPRLDALLELAGRIFAVSEDAPEVHAERVGEASRILGAFGIQTKPKRHALAEILALALVSEPVAPEIRNEAKPLYRDRKTDAGHPERAKYNILRWMRDVWGDELRAGSLTRAKLRRLDPSADKAIENYLQKKELPADIILPKQREVTDAQLAQVRPEELRAAWRLTRTIERRRANQI